MKNREYADKKINSIDDFMERAIEVIKERPKGLKARAVVGILIPEEGQYHLPSSRGAAHIFSRIGCLVMKNSVWRYQEPGK